MSLKHVSLVAGLAMLSLAIAVPTHAEDTQKPGAGKGDKARHEMMLKKFDKNGNGQLDPEEREAARAEMGKNRPEGGKGQRPGGGKMREEMLKKFDKNGNGQLDDDEKAAAKAEFEKRRAERGGQGGPDAPGGGKMREAMLKKFDKNGNGKMDPDEIEAAKAAHAERMKNRPQGGKPGEGDKPRTKPAPKPNDNN